MQSTLPTNVTLTVAEVVEDIIFGTVPGSDKGFRVHLREVGMQKINGFRGNVLKRPEGCFVRMRKHSGWIDAEDIKSGMSVEVLEYQPAEAQTLTARRLP